MTDLIVGYPNNIYERNLAQMVIGEKSGCFKQKWLQIGLFFSGEDGFFQRDFAHSRNKKSFTREERETLPDGI